MATLGEACVLICNVSELDLLLTESLVSSIFFLNFELKHSSTSFFSRGVFFESRE